jgi:hypothetical protein
VWKFRYGIWSCVQFFSETCFCKKGDMVWSVCEVRVMIEYETKPIHFYFTCTKARFNLNLQSVFRNEATYNLVIYTCGDS